jgi:SNF2 family DNA or RNA helicase
MVGSSAVAFGLNLQVANYTVFFESPDSLIVRQQMERRTVRPGQTKQTFIYDLVTRNSVEQKILDSLVAGRNLHERLIRGEEQLW